MLCAFVVFVPSSGLVCVASVVGLSACVAKHFSILLLNHVGADPSLLVRYDKFHLTYAVYLCFRPLHALRADGNRCPGLQFLPLKHVTVFIAFVQSYWRFRAHGFEAFRILASCSPLIHLDHTYDERDEMEWHRTVIADCLAQQEHQQRTTHSGNEEEKHTAQHFQTDMSMQPKINVQPLPPLPTTTTNGNRIIIDINICQSRRPTPNDRIKDCRSRTTGMSRNASLGKHQTNAKDLLLEYKSRTTNSGQREVVALKKSTHHVSLLILWSTCPRWFHVYLSACVPNATGGYDDGPTTRKYWIKTTSRVKY